MLATDELRDEIVRVLSESVRGEPMGATPTCFQTVFPNSGISVNDATKFKAKGPE